MDGLYLDQGQNLLVYQVTEENQLRRQVEHDDSNSLKICFLKKNECVYNQLKQA